MKLSDIYPFRAIVLLTLLAFSCGANAQSLERILELQSELSKNLPQASEFEAGVNEGLAEEPVSVQIYDPQFLDEVFGSSLLPESNLVSAIESASAEIGLTGSEEPDNDPEKREGRIELQVNGTIQRAVFEIKQATQFVMLEFCDSAARPSFIELSLTADFKLVVGGSTGAKATWDLEKICA